MTRRFVNRYLFFSLIFGALVGLIFPFIARIFTTFRDERFVLPFTLLCIGTGLLVGATSYLIGRTILLRKPKQANKGLQVNTDETKSNNKVDSIIAISNELVQALEIRTKELEAERNKLDVFYKNMQKEINMARKIQMNLIPKESPNPNIAFYYKPMESVGGDFFDFIQCFNPNWTGIFISDVAGHGIPAAFITSMIKGFNLQFAEVINDPSELLLLLNKYLLDQIDDMFVTVFYGIYDKSTRILTYASAGHSFPFVIKGDEIEHLDKQKNGIPLAMFNNEEMKKMNVTPNNHQIQFEIGSKLFVYTDGLTEAVHINEGKHIVDDILQDFQELGLMPALEAAKKLPATKFIDTMVEKLIEFRGADSFEDDVCLICMDIE